MTGDFGVCRIPRGRGDPFPPCLNEWTIVGQHLRAANDSPVASDDGRPHSTWSSYVAAADDSRG